jgi:hypothetical protein
VESWYRAGEPGRGATVQTDSRVDCGKALPGHRMRAGKEQTFPAQYSSECGIDQPVFDLNSV